MLLAIDIGNSFAKFGIFDGDRAEARFSLPTAGLRDASADVSAFPATGVTRVVVSSVVPEANRFVAELSAARYGVAPWFVRHSDFPLENSYENPDRLGIDRLVAAFAAFRKHGAPAVVCDFGTATTIDGVADGGVFLGGVIAPGMRTMAESLFSRTAQLPNVEIAAPTSVFGRNTFDAIRAGVYFGYLGLVREIVGRMKSELGAGAKVIATGGFAALLAENLDLFDAVEPDLVLDGLRELK